MDAAAATPANPATTSERLQGLFGNGERLDGKTVLSTYRGPARVKVLSFMEKLQLVPPGVAEAARNGATWQEVGRGVGELRAGGEGAAEAGARMLGMSGAGAAGPHADNPVAHGLLGQQLFGTGGHGFQQSAMSLGNDLPGNAGMNFAAVGEAASAAAPGVAAATGAAAAPEQLVAARLEDLIQATPEQRLQALARTVENMAAAGHGPGLEQVLAMQVIDAPAEHSAPALLQALQSIGLGADDAGAAARAAASEAAPAARAAASEAAPAATRLGESGGKLLAQTADNISVLEQVLAKAARVAPRI